MILIVDDKKENLFSLKKILELNRFATDTAQSGEEALKKILKEDYSLIILDVQMPGMDGFEVAETVAGYSKSKDIPILFLSAANTDKSFIAKGYASGAVDYITKPVDPDILLLKVKTFIRLYEQTKALNEMQAALRAENEIRRHAESALKIINEELESRVTMRTHELQRANYDLELSNHDLQQFASVASHDLKEPLRKIQVYTSILQNRYNDPEDTELANYISRIFQSSKRMYQLINDLLNYSKLSEKSLFQKADLNQIIAEILTDLELLVQEKQADIHITSLPEMEVIPGQIRQLFQNLITNALKFSKKDEPPVIRISCELVAEKSFASLPAPGGDYCRITVADNGIGFNEMFVDKIFTIFQRLNAREEYEGTGIGLAIAKKIVEKHSGLITARSDGSSGAAFIILLPLMQEHTVASV